jgi:archaellum component FlaC
MRTPQADGIMQCLKSLDDACMDTMYENNNLQESLKHAHAELDRLKAEVERLTNELGSTSEAFEAMMGKAKEFRDKLDRAQKSAASPCVLPELSEDEINRLTDVVAFKCHGESAKRKVNELLLELRAILASRPASAGRPAAGGLDVPADVLEKCAEAAHRMYYPSNEHEYAWDKIKEGGVFRDIAAAVIQAYEAAKGKAS